MNVPTRLSILTAALALSGLISAAHGQVVQGPITNPANGHRYYLVDVSSYADFVLEASTLSGYPVVINNAAENAWVTANVAALASANAFVYIGLTDEAEEGRMAWSGGVRDTYRNWTPGEPNNSTANSAGGEDYVQINRLTGLWNDIRNPSAFGITVGIVEVGGGTVGDPAGIYAGPIINPATGNSYYILTPSAAGNAQRFASNLGGHLVTINDVAEQDWITWNVANISGTTTTMNIGLNDLDLEGTYVWTSEQASAYRNWGAGEPNNFGAGEDQVTITAASFGSRLGEWLDQSDAPRHSIIEVSPPTFCPGDFNRSSSVTVQDVFDFLTAWFATCP